MANIKKIQLPSGSVYDIYDAGAARKEDLTNLKTEIKSEILGAAPEELNTLEELAAALGADENFSTTVLNEIGKKVDKVEGKGLSTEDFTTEEKEKLASLESNAQGDWNIDDISNPAYIKNKTHYKQEYEEVFANVYPNADATETIPFIDLNITFEDGTASFDGTDFLIEYGTKKIKINYDGIDYILFLNEDSFPPSYGDIGIDPIILTYFSEGAGFELYSYVDGVQETGITSHNISIYGIVEEYHKLDLNYLPDGISTTPISYNYQELSEEEQVQARENIGAIGIEQLEENKISLAQGKNINISVSDNIYTIKHENISTENSVLDAIELNNGDSFTVKEVETDNGHITGIKETEIKLPNIKIEKQVQSDWAQSSASEKSYVKNRTHYKEEILENWTTTPDFTELVVTLTDGEKFWSSEEHEFNSMLFDGTKTQVIWDGITYNLTAYEAGVGVHIGGNEYPFQIGDSDSGVYIYSFNSGVKESGETSHTVTIRLIKDSYKKLDLEYLPNEIIISDYQELSEAQKTQVKENLGIKDQVQSNWNSNNSSSNDFIKNRTHYIDASGNYIPLDERFIPESIRNKQNKINSGYTLPSYAEVGTIFLLLEEE